MPVLVLILHEDEEGLDGHSRALLTLPRSSHISAFFLLPTRGHRLLLHPADLSIETHGSRHGPNQSASTGPAEARGAGLGFSE